MALQPTNRQRRYIGRKTAENAFHGRRFMEQAGESFTHLITVNWSLSTKSVDYVSRLHVVFREKLLRSSRYHRGKTNGRPMLYLEVVENPDDQFHSHIAVSIETAEEGWLSTSVNKFVKGAIGEEPPNDMIDIRPIYAPGSMFKYLMKGVSPVYADYFHMRTSEQGLLPGRRVSMSRRMGPTARRRAGWRR